MEEEFTDEELWAASLEHSPQYDGIVLAKAIEIVRYRVRMNYIQFAHLLGFERRTVTYHRRGRPVTPNILNRWLLFLVDAETRCKEEHAVQQT